MVRVASVDNGHDLAGSEKLLATEVRRRYERQGHGVRMVPPAQGRRTALCQAHSSCDRVITTLPFFCPVSTYLCASAVCSSG